MHINVSTHQETFINQLVEAGKGKPLDDVIDAITAEQ